MDVNHGGVRLDARLVGRVVSAGSVKRRRVFTWRNWIRSRPHIADQTGCPLQVLRPRLYSYASIGSRIGRIGTSLRFDLRNISDKTIHSYFWRHASPVREANGGYGCEPEGGMPPDALHREVADLGWRGAITLTIDFVQFRDGDVWLSSDPRSAVTRAGLQAGAQQGADHLLRVLRDGGISSLGDALRRIHRDVQETAMAPREGERNLGTFGFYAGVTRAAVVARSVPADGVQAALLELRVTATSP
jgi:hypothetical protein